MLNPITIIIGILAIGNMCLGTATFFYYKQYNELNQSLRKEQEFTKLVKHEADIKYADAIDRHNIDIDRMRSITKTSILPTPTKPDQTEICFDREQLDTAIQQYRYGIQELISKGSESQIDLDNAKEYFLEIQGRSE